MRHNQYITTYASAGSEDSITDQATKGIVDELRMKSLNLKLDSQQIKNLRMRKVSASQLTINTERRLRHGVVECIYAGPHRS